MIKKLYSLLLAVLTLTGLMTGCKSNDDIVFDHERQQFETRADRILLEFIAPFGTTPTEEIYILGAFNGEEEAVWLLLTALQNGASIWILQPSSMVRHWQTVSTSIQ